ncbi:hypothetical protein, partial [Rhodovulum sp. 12E13]|uniref:hypothetical protein n=1 Tax=Rhodovulum sp. 12E13 TaxID=2203891 RepID=UPI001F21F809
MKLHQDVENILDLIGGRVVFKVMEIRAFAARAEGNVTVFIPQYSPNASERRIWRSWAGREDRSRVVQTLPSGATPVDGARGP